MTRELPMSEHGHDLPTFMVRPARRHWSVEWGANAYGCQVVVRNRDGILIDEATRGNHFSDAIKTVEEDDPLRLPLEQLRQIALRQAQAFAEEYRIPPDHVREDDSLLS
jgi:hypothetical protein